MKAKHSILLIAIGFCLGYLGSFSKIMHSAEANALIFISTLLKISGVAVLAYKVIKYEGFRKFMER